MRPRLGLAQDRHIKRESLFVLDMFAKKSTGWRGGIITLDFVTFSWINVAKDKITLQISAYDHVEHVFL